MKILEKKNNNKNVHCDDEAMDYGDSNSSKSFRRKSSFVKEKDTLNNNPNNTNTEDNSNLNIAVIKTLDKFSDGFTFMFDEMRRFSDKSFEALIKSNERAFSQHQGQGTVYAEKHKNVATITYNKHEHKNIDTYRGNRTMDSLNNKPGMVEISDLPISDNSPRLKNKKPYHDTGKQYGLKLLSSDIKYKKDFPSLSFTNNRKRRPGKLKRPINKNILINTNKSNEYDLPVERTALPTPDSYASGLTTGPELRGYDEALHSAVNTLNTDTEIRSSRYLDNSEGAWQAVESRKVKRRQKRADADTVNQNYRRSDRFANTKKLISPSVLLKRRLPRSVAICITCGPNSSYADTLKKARDNIDINKLGIEYINAKRAITGGLIMELSGENLDNKANTLINKLKDIFNNTDVKIYRPSKKAELRLSGFDESITTRDIMDALTTNGKCHQDDFRHSEIKFFRGLGSIWIKCPIAVALRILEKNKTNKLTIGWCAVKIELLKNKPMQCFKCSALGHPIQRCPSKTDRFNKCMNCGDPNHMINQCRNKSKCQVCEERGLRSDHRVGSMRCVPYPPGKFNPNVNTGNRSPEMAIERLEYIKQ